MKTTSFIMLAAFFAINTEAIVLKSTEDVVNQELDKEILNLKNSELPWDSQTPNAGNFNDDHRTIIESTSFHPDSRFHKYTEAMAGANTHVGTFWS